MWHDFSTYLLLQNLSGGKSSRPEKEINLAFVYQNPFNFHKRFCFLNNEVIKISGLSPKKIMILKNSSEIILTQSNFEMLLKWLSEDREIAGYKYETIRFKIKKFFYAKGCTHAEELADETIDRVIKKIDFLQKNYVGEPVLYFQGVARKVFLEYTRKVDENELPPNLADNRQLNNQEIENLYFCLDESLKQIPADQRDFILEYYSGAKDDKIRRCRRVSQNQNISPEAIRVQVHRIKIKLQKVFQKTLSNQAQKKF